jgi:hypothetical protein
MRTRTLVKGAKNKSSVVNLCEVNDTTGKRMPCEHLAEIPMQKVAEGKDTKIPEEKYKDAVPSSPGLLVPLLLVVSIVIILGFWEGDEGQGIGDNGDGESNNNHTRNSASTNVEMCFLA